MITALLAGCPAQKAPTGAGAPPIDPYFFEGPLDDDPTVREERLAARAIHRIDACGFLDPQSTDLRRAKLASFTHGGGTTSFDCLLTAVGQPKSTVRLSVMEAWASPGVHGPLDDFTVDGVRVRVGGQSEASDGSPVCSAHVDLDMAALPGAPLDPLIGGLLVIESKTPDNPCEQAKVLATAAASVKARKGLPHQTGIRIATLEPCAIRADLQQILRDAKLPEALGDTGIGPGNHASNPWECNFFVGVAWGRDPQTVDVSLELFTARQLDAWAVVPRDGVELRVSRDPFSMNADCDRVAVATHDRPVSPVRLDGAAANQDDLSFPGVLVSRQRLPDCEALEEVAVAAAKRFGA